MLQWDNPNEIAVAPIYDLPAKWSYFYDYHPIHPTNKYGVGERLGNLMLSNSNGEDGLKTAAYFKKSVRKKGALELSLRPSAKILFAPDIISAASISAVKTERIFPLMRKLFPAPPCVFQANLFPLLPRLAISLGILKTTEISSVILSRLRLLQPNAKNHCQSL